MKNYFLEILCWSGTYYWDWVKLDKDTSLEQFNGFLKDLNQLASTKSNLSGGLEYI